MMLIQNRRGHFLIKPKILSVIGKMKVYCLVVMKANPIPQTVKIKNKTPVKDAMFASTRTTVLKTQSFHHAIAKVMSATSMWTAFANGSKKIWRHLKSPSSKPTGYTQSWHATFAKEFTLMSTNTKMKFLPYTTFKDPQIPNILCFKLLANQMVKTLQLSKYPKTTPLRSVTKTKRLAFPAHVWNCTTPL